MKAVRRGVLMSTVWACDWLRGRSWEAERLGSESLKESDERRALCRVRRAKRLASGFGLPAVPQDRFLERSSTAVVKKGTDTKHVSREPDAPEWRRPPLRARRLEVGAVVREVGTHVVK